MSELAWFSLLITAYYAAVNTSYLVQIVVGWRAVRRRMRGLALEDFRDLRESGLAPPISIVVPAYNEGKNILESVRSLLGLRYPRLEVVVVNDGSTDDTLDQLIAEFGLRRTPRVYWQRIRSRPVRAIWWSPAFPRLMGCVSISRGGPSPRSACHRCRMAGVSSVLPSFTTSIGRPWPAMSASTSYNMRALLYVGQSTTGFKSTADFIEIGRTMCSCPFERSDLGKPGQSGICGMAEAKIGLFFE